MHLLDIPMSMYLCTQLLDPVYTDSYFHLYFSLSLYPDFHFHSVPFAFPSLDPSTNSLTLTYINDSYTTEFFSLSFHEHELASASLSSPSSFN